MADALILGAGPAGLAAVFQLGLCGLSAEVIEQAAAPGGQMARYEASKLVYDVPGLLEVTGAQLLAGLHAQAAQMKPLYRFGERVTGFTKGFRVTCASGAAFEAPVLILAGGPAFARDVRASDCAVVDEPGLFAIGDAARYAGKLNYLLPAFHEAQLAAIAAFHFLKESP